MQLGLQAYVQPPIRGHNTQCVIRAGTREPIMASSRVVQRSATFSLRAPCLPAQHRYTSSGDQARRPEGRRWHLPVALASAAPHKPGAAHDPLRDGPLRYLGYANELGEAFGTVLARSTVNVTYAVSIAYVIVDTYDKTKRALNDVAIELNASGSPSATQKYKLARGVGAALDCFLWQMLASVILPGLCIHKVVHVVSAMLDQGMTSAFLAPVVSSLITTFHCTPEVVAIVVSKALPTLVGMATIPLIIHPIDSMVDSLFNATLRPWLSRTLDKKRQAAIGLDGSSAAA